MDYGNSFYNLIVRAKLDSQIPNDRLLEGTPSSVRGFFETNGVIDYTALSLLPSVMVQEFLKGDDATIAEVGYMNCYSNTPSMDRVVATVKARDLVDAGVMGGLYTHRTYWAVLPGDIFKMIAGRTTLMSKMSNVKCDPTSIAVMMPFDERPELSHVYSSIKKGSEAAGYRCIRVDENKRPGNIVSKVKETIETSRAVIVDISGFNPNVMYEFGYAQKCEKPTIVLCEKDFDKLPFDVCQESAILYRKEESCDLEKLAADIADALKTMTN